MYRVNFTCL